MKRWGLFILTNILVIITINVLLSVLGIGSYITAAGLDYYNLSIFCLIWGMAGSFISLLLSKKMAKWMMGVQVIDAKDSGQYRWLVDTVHNLARKAQLPKMPEVGVYPSAEVNAFATGPSRSNSLVAVSEGILHAMNQDELEGVLAHEVAHIQNGDMVTMTLIQGVVNAFALFLSKVIAHFVSQSVDEENRWLIRLIVDQVAYIVLTLLGFLVVCWFSRQREFRADRGSARLCGSPSKMVKALQKLGSLHGVAIEKRSAMDTAKISGGKNFRFSPLSTHPSVEARIHALGA